MLVPGGKAEDYVTGSIQRVDVVTGRAETLYTSTGDVQLMGPNAIVFDARVDGSMCREAIFPLADPNGIGLSPNRNDALRHRDADVPVMGVRRGCTWRSRAGAWPSRHGRALRLFVARPCGV